MCAVLFEHVVWLHVPKVQQLAARKSKLLPTILPSVPISTSLCIEHQSIPPKAIREWQSMFSWDQVSESYFRYLERCELYGLRIYTIRTECGKKVTLSCPLMSAIASHIAARSPTQHFSLSQFVPRASDFEA